MRKACLVVSEYLAENRIFDSRLHRDNCLDCFVQLKKYFAQKGYDLSTQDINSVDDSDFVIYAANMPDILPKTEDIHKCFIILSESAFIMPNNYDVKKHRCFNKIFTWSDDIVDDIKYIKLNFAHAFPESINKDLANKTKLCVLIAGNKKPKYALDCRVLELDLYLEREKAIRWFEKNQLQDFDLYGVGWSKFLFTGPNFIRGLNRIPLLPELVLKISGRSYPSYKGTVENKKPVMEKYRFSICYENARDIPGYITEKIFDSFFAGCVPVYRGASNVTDFIPKNCFVDKRDFASYEELYKFLKSMPDDDYMAYLNNIENFLSAPEAMPYRSEGFASKVAEAVLNSQDSKQL
jgi:hypothetical protein